MPPDGTVAMAPMGEAEAVALARSVSSVPDLEVDFGNLAATARRLRDLLARRPVLFERGGRPVRVVVDPACQTASARPLTVHGVVLEAHTACRPVTWRDEAWREVTLPERVAKLYLELHGEFGLRPLDGLASSPLLAEDGEVRPIDGYDLATRLWCFGVPEIPVPGAPTRAEAEKALAGLRRAFMTFPFGDAERVRDPNLGLPVVDLGAPPGADESTFLAGLLTAVCRPNLPLAPGLAVVAPPFSGAGTGKGLLVRGASRIAFGVEPSAVPPGGGADELDKRIAAALMDADPVLLLDNLNDQVLRSDVLASVLTERPASVRPLGRSAMLRLNSAAFVAATGNGLRLSEDLTRRFLTVRLDAGIEDPEARPFPPGFLAGIGTRRGELLAMALTIWRWGRRLGPDLPRGVPLGSYETWAAWVRDPLLALGCRDPVRRIAETKGGDPRRLEIAAVFAAWRKAHGEAPVAAAELHEDVRRLLDPLGRNRQVIVSELDRLAGTRLAGAVLVKHRSSGKWTRTRYALRSAGPVG